MGPDEAAVQMDLLGHDFYLFTNSETGHAAVVYRRNDGHLGLIETPRSTDPDRARRRCRRARRPLELPVQQAVEQRGVLGGDDPPVDHDPLHVGGIGEVLAVARPS